MERLEFSFEQLEVWQKSRALVKKVYVLLRCFPQEERFALCDQIRRAVVSVPSNIAEGSGRFSTKEKIHFLEIAFGSLMETFCQLQIAADLSYITEGQLQFIKADIVQISKMLTGLRSSFMRKI